MFEVNASIAVAFSSKEKVNFKNKKECARERTAYPFPVASITITRIANKLLWYHGGENKPVALRSEVQFRPGSQKHEPAIGN